MWTMLGQVLQRVAQVSEPGASSTDVGSTWASVRFRRRGPRAGRATVPPPASDPFRNTARPNVPAEVVPVFCLGEYEPTQQRIHNESAVIRSLPADGGSKEVPGFSPSNGVPQADETLKHNFNLGAAH